MEHVTRNVLSLVAAGCFALVAGNAQAQCTTWNLPTASTGWTDFNGNFGGAPCDDGTGCPFNEITDFEVFADEAYAMDNVQAGGTYTFSACNGVGGTAWDLHFTIVAPSGAVDAFGLNEGLQRELTRVASETGSYLIVVSEEGACGTSANTEVANGFPAITCDGVACPEPQPGCTTWFLPTTSTGWGDFNTEFDGAPVAAGGVCPLNEITDFEVFADEAYSMTNVVEGMEYTFSACNGVGGTAWNLHFTIINPSGIVDAFGLDAGSNCELTWTASASGNYLIVISEDGACGTSTNTEVANGFPAITCNGTVGIGETTTNGSFRVFPNPTHGIFTIDMDRGLLGGNTLLEVLDISGRRVMTARVNSEEVLKQIDLSAQPAGSYVVCIRQDGIVTRQNLMVVK